MLLTCWHGQEACTSAPSAAETLGQLSGQALLHGCQFFAAKIW